MLFSFELIAYDIDKHRFAPCTAFIDFGTLGSSKAERKRFKFHVHSFTVARSNESIEVLQKKGMDKRERQDLRWRDEIYECEGVDGKLMEIPSYSIFSLACVHP